MSLHSSLSLICPEQISEKGQGGMRGEGGGGELKREGDRRGEEEGKERDGLPVPSSTKAPLSSKTAIRAHSKSSSKSSDVM